jgi:alkylation response protein AidB-like acyl-CoA dehydrogenase
MDVSFSKEEIAFRDEVRSFLQDKYPEHIRRKQDRGIHLSREEHIEWQKVLYEQGWIAPNWPVEYGGTGWSPVQKYIFSNEIARANAPSVIPFGLSMVGPVIYSFGNEEQKQRFLPDILASNVWWCQGYSEPGAGSDLASLKTLAERDGDHYVVNGTKTWTTLGQHADWIFFLARTSTDVARRQEGISFLLADMKTPGISVRPIITIEGGHEVNEVHFENVRVPVENLVGEEGKGWTYGKVLLQHERTNIAGVARSKYRLDKLKELASTSQHGAEPLMNDPAFRAKIAQTEIELRALEYTDLRTLAAVATGKAPGPESSILKIKGTEMQQQLDSMYLEAAGYYAMPFVPDQFSLDASPDDMVVDSSEPLTALKYFNFRKASIYGGSNEIQKNIIAKHVLGL